MRIFQGPATDSLIKPFFRIFPFGFVMFSGGSKENNWEKRVNLIFFSFLQLMEQRAEEMKQQRLLENQREQELLKRDPINWSKTLV